MSDDDTQNKYIHQVIKDIKEEIRKLHAENDIIMQQNQEIIDKLNNLSY